MVNALTLASPRPAVLPSPWLKRATILSLAVLVVSAVAHAVQPTAALPHGSVKADPALVRTAAAHPDSAIRLIVRETQPSSDAAERLVRDLGGTVTHGLPIIGSFSARLPGRSLGALLDSPAIWRVWGDGHLRATATNMSQYDTNSPDTAWKPTIAPSGWSYQAPGVTVALLDTGVTRVPDLGNRVLARVDFTPDHDGYDRYGHGTHMAGIIAGDGSGSGGQWGGVAPKANLVSIKVASTDGSTDVSVVIAGMQWAVSHRAQYNIRVLNLSYGTDSRQSYLVDPLDYAVEQVWESGIFVVVAAGNRGADAGTVTKPGDDPFVMTVGAADTKNTAKRLDDDVPPFSSRGPTQDGIAKPDLVAPAISIVSNRAPGSTIDQQHPDARVGDSYFKGTGTSQAAAVVSGVAALMFSAAPALTPDMAKAIMTRTTDRKIVWNMAGVGTGSGLVDADAAVAQVSKDCSWIQPANVGLAASNGLGSLELSRGSYHVSADLNDDGVRDLVIGEIDVLGNTWYPRRNGNSWGGYWDGNSWAPYVFEGNSWSGNTWSGNTWSGTSWLGNTWSGNTWSSGSWS